MRTRKLLLAAFATVLAISWPMASARAELVVVAHPKSGIERMSREEVIYVFMGRWRHLPSGLPAQPIDALPDSPEYAQFYRQLVNKEPSEIKAYWSRLIFSGGVRPPVQPESIDEQMKILSSTPGAIGYIERTKADARVRIIFEFPGTDR